MESLLQILQLNIKTLLILAKVYLTAVIVSMYTHTSVNFENILSPTNVNFAWNFVLVFGLFYLLIEGILGFVCNKGVVLVIKRLVQNNTALEFAKFANSLENDNGFVVNISHVALHGLCKKCANEGNVVTDHDH